jgi:hypothetical protein
MYKMKSLVSLKILLSVVLIVSSFNSYSQAPDPLPTGNNGIAKNYPNDEGIDNNPFVIYADNFESYNSVSGLTASGRWNEAYHTQNIRLATEPENYYHGTKALEFKVPQTNNEVSNTLLKYIEPTQDIIFIRFYAKFDDGFNVSGSSHNGSTISSSYWEGPGGGPGIPADGYNKFLVSGEAWRDGNEPANPGSLNAYVYHPEQRDIWGDHFFPTGRVIPFDYLPGDFGPFFISRPEVVPELDRWYAYEIMVKANTPGERDGRIAFWLDGELIADWLNIRLRDTTDLKVDRVSIDLHVKNNTLGVAKKYYDNVVIATSYIGLMMSTTDINEPPENLVDNFQLFQNYPNPFNPTTKINWQSAVGSWQTLKVFDVLGNEVATLVDEYKPTGKYEIQFNASKLSSGTYFYQLRVGDPWTSSGQGFIQTKKMILMK